MPAIPFEESHPTRYVPGYYPAPEVKAYDPAADEGLQRAIARGRQLQAEGYGVGPGADHDPVCPQCKAQGSRELYGGRCKHRPTPAEAAEQVRWQRKAAALIFVQQQAAGYFRDPVVVLTESEAAQRDSYRGPPPPIDRVHLELL